MAWYTPIYVFVREYRLRNPVRGFFLHLMLNAFLVLQLLCVAYSYYVYSCHLCGRNLLNPAQSCVYLSVYNWLLFFTLWSLTQALRTSPERIPEIYYLDEETDKQLKDVTHFEEGRYHADRSTSEQIHQQKVILDAVAEKRGLHFVETDIHCRVRYCYICELMKPDRCHHCSCCGTCVPKFDHHCPWINKCVSHSNYKHYVLMLGYGLLLVAWSILTSIEGLVRCFIDNKHDYTSFGLILSCLSFQVPYFVLGFQLLKYHIELMVLNETTCEQTKIPKYRGQAKELYNWGKLNNFRSALGWGLWAFPVDTRIGDGIHFSVHYDKDYDGERIVLRVTDR
ncbi:SPE-10 protein [Aphelenchoides avenae]|nr:SPE-10 protein [Aphelenchus avenae]